MPTDDQRPKPKFPLTPKGVGRALHTAFPVEPAASFNPEIASLLSLLDQPEQPRKPKY